MTSIKSEILIDANILRKNIKVIKNKLQKNSKFMAVIKSDAYGHNISRTVEDIDDLVDGYGVVRIEEALEIRKQSNKKVLLMQGVYSKEEYILSKNQKLGNTTFIHFINRTTPVWCVNISDHRI